MMDNFKDIEGYEGVCQINKLGQVRSSITGALRKTGLSNSGYVCINLRYKGVQRNHFIHRLVMIAFTERVVGKDFINHIDGNKQNNALSNLEWCDRSHNMKHAYKIGLAEHKVMKKLGESPHAKQIIQLALNGTPIKMYTSLTEAELETGTWHQDISKVCRGKRPTANGFKWKYAPEIENGSEFQIIKA